MTDAATHPKIIALRTVLSKLSECSDEYAQLYEEVRALDKTGSDSVAKRKDLATRLTKIMLCMMAQAHLVQCRFFYTLAGSVGEDETMNRLRDAVIEAHENEERETNDLHSLMKGHATWQM